MKPNGKEYEAIGHGFLPYVSRDDFFASSNSFNLFVAAAASSVFLCNTYKFQAEWCRRQSCYFKAERGKNEETYHFLPLI